MDRRPTRGEDVGEWKARGMLGERGDIGEAGREGDLLPERIDKSDPARVKLVCPAACSGLSPEEKSWPIDCR